MRVEHKMVVCPVCGGTGRRQATDDDGYVKNRLGYEPETHTLPCNNCGGQKQWGSPTGKVRLRPNGKPCVHEYQHKLAGNCLHEYTCAHCGDKYEIDTGG